jgi:hypothetical protein
VELQINSFGKHSGATIKICEKTNLNKMGKTTGKNQDEIKLEDLLRFKRAEKPDEAFWDRFDQELHQRTLRALVKKDPWYVQVLRGLSGRLAQTTAIGAAAAVLAMMVVQPAFVGMGVGIGGSGSEAYAEAADQKSATEAFGADSDPAAGLTGSAAAYTDPDYGIEVYAVDVLDGGPGVTREFGLDRMEVSNYDSAAYSADPALGGFASTSVASLVF